MKKQFVFIDDSGDPGFKGSASSSAFVMAGAVIMSPEVASAINQEITDLRKELGWKEWHEFKFNKATKKVKLKFLNRLNQYDFKIYAVYIRKANYPALFRFSDEEKLYNWAMRELLEIIPLNNATIKVDGKYGNRYRAKLRTYIRKKLNLSERKVAKFDVQDSRENNLIQLADFVAGTINRSFQSDKTDYGEYIRIIEGKIVELYELDLNSP